MNIVNRTFHNRSGTDAEMIAKIESAIEAAYREGEAKLKGNGKSVPALSVLKTPLRDGDLERPDDPAYAGSYFVNANAICSRHRRCRPQSYPHSF